jgi:outer membrane biosynthesis protein TonB
MVAVSFTYNDFQSDNAELFDENKQDKLFSRLLIAFLSLYLVFGILVPMMDRVELPREIKEQVPVQLTRVLLQKQEKIKEIPPPVIEEEPKPEESVEELVKEQVKTKREVAKEKAKTSGLAAMKDDLLSLREAFIVKPNKGALIEEKVIAAETVKRKLLAAKANEQSQSIASAKTSKTVLSDELSTHNTQKIHLAEEEVLASSMGEGTEPEISLANVRSEMKLRQTLEANKSRLYSLYNRALRKNPFLKGKVLFEIEIQPNGRVSSVTIQSSELEDKALERRLKTILKSIDFGVEDVEEISTVWAIEFLPR